jgi:hypothetical protein
MAQRSIADLIEANSINSSDMLIVMTDPTGLNATNKVTANNILKRVSYLAANVFSIDLKTTPANNSAVPTNGKRGTIWYDDNYLYVVTSNGVIKRTELSVF